tara:strand:+ start:112 stop:366 length:255 start_codon:yes stop_codon:yes gene_type:complete
MDSHSDGEYSVIVSNKDDKHSDDELNDMLDGVNGTKTPKRNGKTPEVKKLDKPFSGFLNLRLSKALFVKAKLPATLRQNFEKGA